MMTNDGGAVNRKAVFAWAMYDFANSAFTTLVVTFIYATYFTQAIAPDPISGTVLWSRAVTISALAVALLSPFFGALADSGQRRKYYLIIFTVLSITCTVALFGPLPGQVYPALALFALGNFGFEMGCVFYNAYLPDLAPAKKIGRISGYSWGIGYVGGLAAMFLAMITMVNPETPWFGLSRNLGENIRATNLLTAAWFAIFSLPLIVLVKDPHHPSPAGQPSFSAAIADLAKTFHELRRYEQIVRFLLARLLFNDGLITIFAFGGIYAAGTFNFSFQEIMYFGIVLNVAAGAGAFAFGYYDDIHGGKNTIILSLIGLTIAASIAAVTTSRGLFWLSGILVGLFSGPNQSASRSLMARFIPTDKEGQFFGFFAFSGKFTAFLGPLLFGVCTEIFGTQRAGVASVILFFAAGGVILLFVDEKKGCLHHSQQTPMQPEG